MIAFMRAGKFLWLIVACLVAILFLLSACSKKQEAETDHPRLTPDVVISDVKFHSAALNRDSEA